MLVFNMFDRNDTTCVRFEKVFLTMGNRLEDFWSLRSGYIAGCSRQEDEAFIKRYRKVLVVMSGSMMTDVWTLYYMDVIRLLKDRGEIKVMAMVEDGVVLPSRYRWLNGADVTQIAFY